VQALGLAGGDAAEQAADDRQGGQRLAADGHQGGGGALALDEHVHGGGAGWRGGKGMQDG
jgi:hypothetical protein